MTEVALDYRSPEREGMIFGKPRVLKTVHHADEALSRSVQS